MRELMDKKNARKMLKERRSGLSGDYMATASEQICRRLKTVLDEVGQVDGRPTVMLYRALPGEVNINPLADILRAEGVCVALPKVCGNILEVREYLGEDSLKQGAFGIMEPTGPVVNSDIDVVVVPGLSFDKNGHRIGFGKGFYDLFLSILPLTTLKIGVCFKIMMMDEVPVEEHDVDMDIVITE